MTFPKTEKIWHNGKLIHWDDAKIHVLSHVVSYGSAVFEGIRCYNTAQGPAIFRLRDHIQRLFNSAHIYRMEIPFTIDEVHQGCLEAKANGYVEGIALDVNGLVSEGSGENIFVVIDGAVVTPPLSNCALPGITRHTVMALCRDLNIPVAEQVLPREMLYIANEVFFC